MVKNPPANVGDVGWIPGSGRSPGEGNGNLRHCVFLAGKLHGQRSLEDYNPWGLKESVTTSVQFSRSVVSDSL